MASDSEIPSKAAIELAFGNWALRQARREVEEKFPRLRSIPGNLPMSLLELVESWPVQDQLSMLRARTKKVLNSGQPSGGRPRFELDTRETWALEQFPYPLNVSHVVNEATRRRKEGKFDLPKGALKRSVKGVLKELWGKPVRELGGEVLYLAHVSGVTVYTDVDFGPKLCQMRYEQRLLPRVCDTPVSLVSGEHALTAVSSMIVAGGIEAKWSYLTVDEMPKAAEVLAQGCLAFVEAVPGILEEARNFGM